MPDTIPVLDTKDLRTLVTGAPVKVIVVDKNKVEHLLNPLDMSDIIEYEDKVGHSILAVDHEITVKDIISLVYLSLRKEDCSQEQVEQKRWKYTERQVAMMFDLKFFSNAVNILLDVLRVSGFELKADAEAAAKAAQVTSREKDLPENPPAAPATA